jgi:hypothetical protein
MRRDERRTDDKLGVAGQQPGQRMHSRHLQRVVHAQVGHQPCEPLRQHRFAGSWRSVQEQMMPTGRRGLDRPAPFALADDVVEINLRNPGQRLREQSRLGAWWRLVRHLGPAEQCEHLPQRPHAVHLDAGDQAGFAGVELGDDDALEVGASRGQCHRESTADLTDPAVEAELADDRRLPERTGLDHPGGREQR